LAATAQAVYGLVGVGGATAVLMLLSGWPYARFGPAGFWAMGALCTAAFPVICDSADASAPIPIPARELKPDASRGKTVNVTAQRACRRCGRPMLRVAEIAPFAGDPAL
jgi:hypothetical protein